MTRGFYFFKQDSTQTKQQQQASRCNKLPGHPMHDMKPKSSKATAENHSIKDTPFYAFSLASIDTHKT
jgi:hypothetical protein